MHGHYGVEKLERLGLTKLVRGMNSRDGQKDTLTTESFQVEVTREGNIVPTPTRLDRQNNKKEDTSVHKEENEHLED